MTMTNTFEPLVNEGCSLAKSNDAAKKDRYCKTYLTEDGSKLFYAISQEGYNREMRGNPMTDDEILQRVMAAVRA